MTLISDIHADGHNGARQQTCKVCGCIDKFDFHVPDPIWKKIVPTSYRNSVVCLSCFDELAFRKRIDYSEAVDVLYFAGDQATFKFRTVAAERV